MPRGDKTGPFGMGAMTGRGAGFCNESTANNLGFGRGLGLGFGAGRRLAGGRGNRGYNCFNGLGSFFKYSYSGDALKNPWMNEKEGLKKQAALLETQLSFIKKQLESLNNN